jgi:hypothetical protein
MIRFWIQIERKRKKRRRRKRKKERKEIIREQSIMKR